LQMILASNNFIAYIVTWSSDSAATAT
jgi:hypothetical protein